jgi:hypothetical protein
VTVADSDGVGAVSVLDELSAPVQEVESADSDGEVVTADNVIEIEELEVVEAAADSVSETDCKWVLDFVLGFGGAGVKGAGDGGAGDGGMGEGGGGVGGAGDEGTGVGGAGEGGSRVGGAGTGGIGVGGGTRVVGSVHVVHPPTGGRLLVSGGKLVSAIRRKS